MKFRFSVLAILIVTVLAGCKQKLDITSPNYVELPVVYALLDQQDNPHYIRIEKGYLLKGSAYIGAGNIDSIYYPDVLKVKLVSNTGDSFNLTRVDGNLIGLPKDTGIFANTANYLYTFNGNLDSSKTYKLTVLNTTSGKSVTATTSLVPAFAVYAPFPSQKIDLSNVSPFKVRWQTAANAGVYDLTVRFYYTEFRSIDNTVFRDTFIDIPFFRSYEIATAAGFGSTELTEDGIVKYMASHISAPVDVYRTFNILKGLQFKFAAGGNELTNFINSQQAQSGLASSNALPPYTNVNGGEGLFSSRYFMEVDSVLLSNDALDSLACGSDAGGMHFKNTHGLICN
ncbi:MAG: hypothetical protein JWO06_163 [Bacteroidota bacterium]|nr:hypothetical protein [Bacteroidota bacterium]